MRIERYVRDRQIQLGGDLRGVKKVYLDVNFWIYLREAEAGKPGSPDHLELLSLLKEGVSSGRILCPISEITFFEVMKQTPADERRFATAAIIDKLSRGIALMAEQDRIATEIAHFIYRYAQPGELHDLEELVWTKIGLCFGQEYPFVEGLHEEAQFDLQCDFFDHVWKQSLSALIVHLSTVPFDDRGEVERLATKLDAQIKAHQGQLLSFARTYRDEISGAVDAVGHLISDILADIAEKAGKAPLPIGSPAQVQCVQIAKNLLVGAFDNGKAVPHLRTLHAMANLHAGLRWNRRTMFVGNHFYDFSHASGAIGYCDAFFTEGFLANLINSNHIRLDARYGCATTNLAENAIHLVRKILENPTADSDK